MKHQTSLKGPFHATWLQSYALCGMKAKLQIEQPPEFTSLAQFKGSVVHRMLYTGDGDLMGAIKHCTDQLEAPLKEEPDLAFAEDCQALFEGACTHAPPHDQHLMEFKWTLEMGRYDMEGTFDTLWDMPNGETWLVDYKTNKQLPSQFYLDNNLQFSIYAWALRGFGIHIDKIAWVHLRDWLPYKKNTVKEDFTRTDSLLHWSQQQVFDYNKNDSRVLVKGHTRGPGVHLTQRTDAQLDETEREVRRLVKGIKFGIFPRCMNDQICSQCNFKVACGAALEGNTNITVTKEMQQLTEEIKDD